MQQNYHKAMVPCNGNNFSFGISRSSADRPVECAVLAGALIESDHWFVQQELKSDKFNSPIPKLGKSRNAKEMRHSAAGWWERDEKFTTFNHSQHVMQKKTELPVLLWRLCRFLSFLWDSSMAYGGDLHVDEWNVCFQWLHFYLGLFSSWERKQLLGGYITLVNIPMLSSIALRLTFV